MLFYLFYIYFFSLTATNKAFVQRNNNETFYFKYILFFNLDSDVFQQFIDANFPNSANLSYAAHNFTGIDITNSIDGTSLDEIFVDPINPSAATIEPSHQDLETPELLVDNTEAIDFEIETETRTTSILVATQISSDDDENSKKSKRKSVRFLNATPKGSDEKEFENDINENETLLEDTTVQINPRGVIFKDPKVLHTPVPKHFSR